MWNVVRHHLKYRQCLDMWHFSIFHMQKPEDLWKNHSKVVHPKPHRKDSSSWRAIQKVQQKHSFNAMIKRETIKRNIHLTCAIAWKGKTEWWIQIFIGFFNISWEYWFYLVSSIFYWYSSIYLLVLISQVVSNGEQLGLKHFRPVRPLGSGDTGRLVNTYIVAFDKRLEKIISLPISFCEMECTWSWWVFTYFSGMTVCIWWNWGILVNTLQWKLWIKVLCSIGTR